MDRAAAWFLFLIFFIVSTLLAMEVLADLKSMTPAAAEVPGNSLLIGETAADPAANLWFESRDHEKAAELKIGRAETTAAASSLNSAIEVMERLQREHPSFRPDDTTDRLIELNRKKNDWNRQPGKPIEPVSANQIGPDIEDPVIQEPAIGSFNPDSDMDLDILDFKMDIPKIGSGVRPDASASISWENDMSSFRIRNPVKSTPEPAADPSPLSDIDLEGASNSDPSSLWYRAYSLVRLARELEAKGDLNAARRKYGESKSYYDLLNREFPEFKNEHTRANSKLLATKLRDLPRE